MAAKPSETALFPLMTKCYMCGHDPRGMRPRERFTAALRTLYGFMPVCGRCADRARAISYAYTETLEADEYEDERDGEE